MFLAINNRGLLMRLILGKIKIACKSLWPADINQKIKIGDLVFKFNPDRNLSKSEIVEKQAKSYEIAIVSAMKSILKPGDIFIDVGSNIGYLSIVGAALVGKKGEVHSFEPIPAYFQDAKMVADLNNEYEIVVNNFALGDKNENLEIQMTNEPFIGNSTFLPEILAEGISKQSISVPVRRLDEYIEKMIEHKDRIRLIKIDVEGFESLVLKGMEGFFQKYIYRPDIICEIKLEAYAKLGFSLVQLNEFMNKYKYSAYYIEAPKININLNNLKGEVNVIFKAK